ncbi:MAG: inosose dehydratase [Conexibacter sp.]|nr:inosose dehydratase [Conexibacter sp.]
MSRPTATAPGSWGVEPGASPLDPPWPQVLDEIAAVGFDGSELGPVGYYPEEAALVPVLAERGLRLAAGFVMEPFHDARARQATLAIARRTCATLAAAGASAVVLIEALVPERSRTAGRTADAPRLDPAGWETLVELLGETTRLAREEYGLRAVFHPHAGTYVEFADEIARLLGDTAPAELGLCVDTGHAVYAGIEPVELIASYGDRVGHVHVKDIGAGALADARDRERSFEQAVAAGVFTPLGEGDVDLVAVARALDGIDYDGWIVFEQDRLAGDRRASAEAAASLRHLREVGIAPNS